MKMRKLISLVSSLAIATSMFASFATVSYAAEETAANIEVKVSEEYGYYCVDLLFSLKDTTFGVAVSKTERGVDFYSGTGLIGVDINYANLPTGAVYATDGHILPSNKTENTALPIYAYNSGVMSVEEAVGSGEAISLVKISTDFAVDSKTEDEVKAIFSDFGRVMIKTVTVTDVKKGTNVSGDCVTYGISAPGVKHVDADYSININATEEEPTPTATATVVGDYTGDKTEAGNDDESDKATAIVGTPVAPESRATSLVWTVTPNTGDAQQFTQTVDVEGGATYKFGLVLRNITADLIKTVSAVLQ